MRYSVALICFFTLFSWAPDLLAESSAQVASRQVAETTGSGADSLLVTGTAIPSDDLSMEYSQRLLKAKRDATYNALQNLTNAVYALLMEDGQTLGSLVAQNEALREKIFLVIQSGSIKAVRFITTDSVEVDIHLDLQPLWEVVDQP